MPTLLETYGSFEAVVDYVTSSLKEKDPKLDEEDFKKWMLETKDYSPTKYKCGLFADMRLYYYCYLVNKKMKSGTNQHHMILVSGKIGKGKSVLGSQLAALIDPSFQMIRVCYVPSHLFKRFADSNPAESNLIDEGGNFFKGRNAMTKIGKDISQAFQLVRDLQQVLIVCYDEPEKLDKDIIDKFDGIFIKVEKPEKKGNERFKSYIAFNNKSSYKVKELLKKRVPITDKQMLDYVSWHGENTKEMPVLNDFNENIYRSEKRKYLREHMELLANKWKKEYEEPQEQQETVDDGGGWLKATLFRKKNNICYTTQRTWELKGEIEVKKIGGTKYCRHITIKH